MIVTTAPRQTKKAWEQAKRLGEELGASVVPRRGLSVSKLLEASVDNRVIIITDSETRFYDHPDEPPLYFKPRMAFKRVKRLRKSEQDTQLTV